MNNYNDLNQNQTFNEDNSDIFSDNNQNMNTSTIPNNEINNNQDIYNSQLGNTNKFKLILNRKKSFIGCGSAFSIYIDNELVGKIKNGKSLEVDITAGSHVISVNNKNEVTIQVTGDTTADVVIFGANDFGITNINGQGPSVNDENINKKVANAKMKSNVDLVMSLLIQPIISILIIFILKLDPWISIFTLALNIGYILVDIAGIKNIKQFFKENYNSCLAKKIIALFISILWLIPLMYIYVNNINDFDDLKTKFSKNKVSEKNNIDEEEVEEDDSDSDWDLDDEHDEISVQLGDLKIKIPSDFNEYEKESNYIIYMTESQDCTATIMKTPLASYESETAMINNLITSVETQTNSKADNYNIDQVRFNNNVWNTLKTTITDGEMSMKETFYVIKKGDSYYAMQFQNLGNNSLCDLRIINISTTAVLE